MFYIILPWSDWKIGIEMKYMKLKMPQCGCACAIIKSNVKRGKIGKDPMMKMEAYLMNFEFNALKVSFTLNWEVLSYFTDKNKQSFEILLRANLNTALEVQKIRSKLNTEVIKLFKTFLIINCWQYYINKFRHKKFTFEYIILILQIWNSLIK